MCLGPESVTVRSRSSAGSPRWYLGADRARIGKESSRFGDVVDGMEFDVGKTGALILAVLFVILTAEDVFVWVTAGSVPGIEFFLGLVLVVVVWFYAIRAARHHRPPP